MDTAITVVQVFLIVGFTMGGFLKLIIPYAQYTKLPFQSWASDFKPWHIKLVGSLEVSGGIGLIVTLLLHSLTWLTPLPAVGIALYMSGAIATHLRREEYPNIVGNLVFLGLALFVAYGKLVGFAV